MVEEKLLTVKLSHVEGTDRFFIDLWDGEKYLVSVKVSQNVAVNISRDTDIKILM